MQASTASPPVNKRNRNKRKNAREREATQINATDIPIVVFRKEIIKNVSALVKARTEKVDKDIHFNYTKIVYELECNELVPSMMTKDLHQLFATFQPLDNAQSTFLPYPQYVKSIKGVANYILISKHAQSVKDLQEAALIGTRVPAELLNHIARHIARPFFDSQGVALIKV